jgi:hypothetical protein
MDGDRLRDYRRSHSAKFCFVLFIYLFIYLFIFRFAKGDEFLSSNLSWDRAELGPGMVEMAISGQSFTQLVYHLCLTEAGRSLNSFEMLK